MIHKYFAVAARGVETVTAAELERLGAQAVRAVSGGVHFEGDMLLLYRVSLWLRTASRILRPLREFAAQNPEMLYSQTRRVRWEDFLDPTKTLAVHATIEGAAKRAEHAAGNRSGGGDGRRERFRGKESRGAPARQGIDHSMYAALKIKDAIVDRLRREQGERPNVDKENPDIVVHAHFSGGRCTLSLDATGSSLHERGYRLRGTAAPLKETLAATIIDLTGWDGHTPFFDPMCGSGTLVIEAAMKAMQMAPGLARPSFGFQRWPEFDGKAWQRISDEARNQKLATPPCEFFANDCDPNAVGRDGQRAPRRRRQIHPVQHTAIRSDETPDGATRDSGHESSLWRADWRRGRSKSALRGDERGPQIALCRMEGIRPGRQPDAGPSHQPRRHRKDAAQQRPTGVPPAEVRDRRDDRPCLTC